MLAKWANCFLLWAHHLQQQQETKQAGLIHLKWVWGHDVRQRSKWQLVERLEWFWWQKAKLLKELEFSQTSKLHDRCYSCNFIIDSWRMIAFTLGWFSIWVTSLNTAHVTVLISMTCWYNFYKCKKKNICFSWFLSFLSLLM